MATQYEFHPIADIWPMMKGADFDSLKDDIMINGLKEFPTLFEGKILDGRNRAKAMMSLGKPVPVRRFEGTEQDAIKFAISKNNKRRQLSDSQRAMVAARLTAFGRGQDPRSVKEEDFESGDDGIKSALVPIYGETVGEAAGKLDISPRYVTSAKAVIDKGIPELVDKVDDAAISVRTAEKISRIPKDQQREVLASIDKGVKPQQAVKTHNRKQKSMRLADKVNALPDKKYPVLYVDPPWKFETFSENGMDRSADNHYPTMTLHEIESLKVPAHKDCVIFLWVTVPFLEAGIALLNKWGFDYKSSMVWVKDKDGTGYWARNRHELLLIGTKGDIPAPESPVSSVIPWPVGFHSAKPVGVYEIIESYFPDLPKLEMFARGDREGWDSWGNEAD